MSLLHEAFAQSSPPPAPGATQSQTQVPSSAPAQTAPAQPGFLSMITLFAPMFLVIYFLIIRPQQKKMKEHQGILEKLQYNDEIITNSGIYGKVTGITDKVVTVEIADNVRVKLLKSHIAAVNPSKGS